AAAPAPATGPLNIGFAYIGPVGDGGWTFAHDQARKKLEAEFGDKIKTTYVESVPEGADAERVLRDLVTQGNKLVFGTTFGYMDTIQKLGEEFPDVKFEHATGYKTRENVRTYDSRTYEGAYLAGIIAGGMTKTGTLGVVGSVPIPEVLRNLNSFTLGAQSVNPDIKTKVVWVNDWFNPPKETEAATSLINGGADVLFQNTDSPAVLKTAQEKGKRAFGWDSDMTSYGPQAHLASAVIDWVPYYRKTVKDVLEGTWTTGQAWWGVKEGAVDLVSIAEDVPAELKEKVEAAKQGLRDGTLVIWKGPIADNSGKNVLDDGAAADDKFLTSINFYVKGVEGQVPGGR
ncbi:BMP family ABC transporter substrate-binding protein, partial [Melaminivora alkalimesophila]